MWLGPKLGEWLICRHRSPRNVKDLHHWRSEDTILIRWCGFSAPADFRLHAPASSTSVLCGWSALCGWGILISQILQIAAKNFSELDWIGRWSTNLIQPPGNPCVCPPEVEQSRRCDSSDSQLKRLSKHYWNLCTAWTGVFTWLDLLKQECDWPLETAKMKAHISFRFF